MLSFKPTFSLSSFTFIKRLFSSSLLSAIRVVSSEYLRLPNLHLELRGKAVGCARVTAGAERPHLGVCPGPNIPLQGRRGSRGCIPGSPGESGLVSRGSQGLLSPLVESGWGRTQGHKQPGFWPQTKSPSPYSSSLTLPSSACAPHLLAHAPIPGFLSDMFSLLPGSPPHAKAFSESTHPTLPQPTQPPPLRPAVQGG